MYLEGKVYGRCFWGKKNHDPELDPSGFRSWFHHHKLCGRGEVLYSEPQTPFRKTGTITAPVSENSEAVLVQGFI